MFPEVPVVFKVPRVPEVAVFLGFLSSCGS